MEKNEFTDALMKVIGEFEAKVVEVGRFDWPISTEVVEPDWYLGFDEIDAIPDVGTQWKEDFRWLLWDAQMTIISSRKVFGSKWDAGDLAADAGRFLAMDEESLRAERLSYCEDEESIALKDDAA